MDDTRIEDPAKAKQVRECRQRAGIPEQVRHREKWRLALDMLDQMTDPDDPDAWGLPKLPVAGDSGYGDATEFRLALDERGFDYVLEVDPTATAYPADAQPVTPPYSGRGRPPKPAYQDKPSTWASPRNVETSP